MTEKERRCRDKASIQCILRDHMPDELAMELADLILDGFATSQEVVVDVSREMIKAEILAWSGDYRFAGADQDSIFELGFEAGVAFACRVNRRLPCFCGNHRSTVVELSE